MKNLRAASAILGDSDVLRAVFREPIENEVTTILTVKLIRITSPDNSKKLDLRNDFTMKAFLYLVNSLGSIVDRITFTLQNYSRMPTSPTEVIGAY